MGCTDGLESHSVIRGMEVAEKRKKQCRADRPKEQRMLTLQCMKTSLDWLRKSEIKKGISPVSPVFRI